VGLAILARGVASVENRVALNFLLLFISNQKVSTEILVLFKRTHAEADNNTIEFPLHYLPFMRSILLLLLCHLSATLFSQVEVKGRWTVAGGLSTTSFFSESSSINLRLLSPRFKWSEEWNGDDEEKHPERFQNMRLMVELIYRPPLNILCTGMNAQYRLLNSKRLTLEVYGGLKIFWVQQDQPRIAFLKKGEIYYLNMGLICQANFGVISPFIDLGGDHILTVGTEVNIRRFYKKPKGRYKLHPRKNSI